jgi:predicted  nucleic acid-binding Zn-ribbon protein
LQDVAERARQKSDMLQGYGDTVLRAEALEEQLVKARKHAAAMQSKLDTTFAQYHNDIQDMQAKSDELVRKKSLSATRIKVRHCSAEYPLIVP